MLGIALVLYLEFLTAVLEETHSAGHRRESLAYASKHSAIEFSTALPEGSLTPSKFMGFLYFFHPWGTANPNTQISAP